VRELPARPAWESRVFLLRFGADLVPLGCFDAGRNKLGRGQACLDLIAPRPQVRVIQLEDGQQRERTVPVAAAPVHFIASDQTVDGYRLGLSCPPDADPKPPCAGPPSTAGFFALWPPAFGPLTIADRPDLWHKPPGGARPAPPLPAEIADDLTGRLRECGSGKAPPLTAHQRLQLDLDGDGAAEELLTVRAEPIEANSWDEAQALGRGDGGCLPADVDRPHSWFFLYVKRGPRFVRTPLGPLPREAVSPGGTEEDGHREPSIDGEVLAAFDLEGDGASELWLEQPYYEGNNWVVVHLRGGTFQVIDHFVDGT